MKIRVLDLQTMETKIVHVADPKSKRVMRRALELFNRAKSLCIPGVTFTYYLKYSWQLEKGHVWLD